MLAELPCRKNALLNRHCACRRSGDVDGCFVPKPDQSRAIRQAEWETEQLFTEHSSNLMRYVCNRVRNITDIEDIAQETFIRYFRARCNGESIENPKGWLYRVARRLALDQIKKSKPVLLDEAGWRAVEADHFQMPAEGTGGRSLRSSDLAWHLLTDAERDCLQLRAEGLTFREVGEVLDVSISTAASYVARAIKKLRRSVTEPSETPDNRRAPSLR